MSADGETVNVPQVVWAKLDIIIAEQAKTNLSLEKLTGDHRLQAQVLQFTTEAVKAVKAEKDSENKAMELRVADLEKWKWKILGAASALGLLWSVIGDSLLEKIGL